MHNNLSKKYINYLKLYAWKVMVMDEKMIKIYIFFSKFKLLF